MFLKTKRWIEYRYTNVRKYLIIHGIMVCNTIMEFYCMRRCKVMVLIDFNVVTRDIL